MNLNVMMDAASLFPNQFHPQDTFRTLDLGKIVKAKYTRMERPVKYYLIDLSIFAVVDSVSWSSTLISLVPKYAEDHRFLSGIALL